MSEETPRARWSWPWRVLHAVIIVNFAAEIFYVGWIIFVVLAPEGGTSGPLWAQAGQIDMDLMARRRLYAIEGWIAIAGLSVYLAITEVAPRRGLFDRAS